MLLNDCTAEILALTSPLDVCRISLVSKSLKSVADSDSVWERFLPSDYQSIISASLTPVPDFASKKDLYVYLRHHPLLIDAGARDLDIPLVDRPSYWKSTSLPESSYRPSEVSVGVFGVELDKRFAILVPEDEESIYNLPPDLEDRLKKVYEEAVRSNLSSDAEDNDPGLRDDIYLALQHLALQLSPENVSNRLQLVMRRPKLRDDGWFEIELGEFYTENEDDRIEMNFKELKECASLKTGLIVEGIEIRPRMG
ncbi:hypothetical protein H5410_052297 [Solanum commersonii]|uniref:F-box domain-containing protein n=1 Tax=Solanum commersonii TaxID=4109 RepID=A0A9J5X373_SOLCO|nr:hypothetical protein H5410_052297 [Solanum commersonii]